MHAHTISGPGLRATIKDEGAELCSVQGTDGAELLWQAQPAWPRHAPNLFPIVGTLRDNRYRIGNRSYEMGRHGFARDQRFEWVERDGSSCRLALSDSEATRAIYPFAFRFEIAYRIEAATLSIAFTVSNPGEAILPASMGAHPAFRWPLRDGIAKTAHSIEFAAEETAPIRRVSPDGLLRPESFPTPVRGRHLALDEALFAADALIFDAPASRSLRYSAPGGPTIVVGWDDGFPQLGIWSRPGVDLLCIEPWHGMSSPEGFDGAFIDKPGLMLIPPGGSRRAVHSIGLG